MTEQQKHHELPQQVMECLVEFIANAQEATLPEEVQVKVKQHFLIMLACMIQGTKLKPGRLAIEFANQRSPAEEAVIPGTKLLASAEVACFVNGMTARAGESDD